jgi:ACS family hexuronate transporter-like MFS transporter
VAIAAFVLFSSANYLDRQLLAAVAPSVISEFGLTNAAYGALVAAFSMPYMLIAPLSGLFVDRVGLRVGSMIAVGAWSLVGMATGWTSTLRGLAICRMGLGVAEAAAIPCSSKASATYLPPGEQSLGIAVLALGFTIGSVAAPIVVAMVAPQYGWRMTFIACGLVGLAWIPLWAVLSRVFAPSAHPQAAAAPSKSVVDLLRDVRLWGILVANVLIMTLHSMWTNWTTIYLVQTHQLTPIAANRDFAWIPPIFATAGGLFGALLTARLTARGADPLRTRRRICIWFAPLLLITTAVPFMPSPALATAGICASFFICMAMLTNLHVIPIDLFGAQRAAFTAAMLVSSYGLTQTVLSPVLGGLADRYGFEALCVVIAVLPMAGAAVIHTTLKPKPMPALTV